MNPDFMPFLIVFDLDDCLWEPEMFTLSTLPSQPILGDLGNGHGNGNIGAQCSDKNRGQQKSKNNSQSCSTIVRLHKGALHALQQIHQNQGNLFRNTRIALASSADTPFAVECAFAALDILEVIPGLTVRKLVDRGWGDDIDNNFSIQDNWKFGKNRPHIWIGRTTPLSSDKSTTHFPLLQKYTKIPYDEMLFFDDCNWSDHCTMVAERCEGVVCQRVPYGLDENGWEEGLRRFAEKKKGRKQ